jgi:hypothetical protein
MLRMILEFAFTLIIMALVIAAFFAGLWINNSGYQGLQAFVPILYAVASLMMIALVLYHRSE